MTDSRHHHHAHPVLEIDNAVVAYGRVAALQGIDGSIDAGESVALIGPNGAGKSTLLKAILGLVPLQSGSITVLGTTPLLARQRVAYVPQHEALDPDFPITAIEVVLMGRYQKVGWLRRVTRADKLIAAAALDQVGLTERAKAQFGTLSGGQRQRILIARAIAQQAELLLLDEPFNGVDSTTQDVLLGILKELRSHGTSVVMSTHDLAIAHLACDDACLLNKHQLAFGPVAESLTPANLRAAYGQHADTLAGDHTIVAHQ